MRFFSKLFKANVEEDTPPPKPTKYHCIRFMTEKGEQLGMLLTHDEFDTACHRWIQNVSTMPIDEQTDKEDEI